MSKNKWTEKDSARLSGESIKQVKKTWHAARDASQKSGELTERSVRKVSSGISKLIKDAFRR